jgi:hypothetical protein
VQHCITAVVKEVHATRLVLYHDALYDMPLSTREASAYLDNSGMYEIASLEGHRYTGRIDEVYVHWRGFEQAEWSWEPLTDLLRDDPHFIGLALEGLALSRSDKLRLNKVYDLTL